MSGTAHGTVTEIWTSPMGRGPTVSHTEIEAIADAGLAGDRYARPDGSESKTSHGPDRQLTLIEQEQLDWLQATHDITLTGEASRRNLVTIGIGLNALVGKQFAIGGVTVQGMRLCQPCKPLAEELGFAFVELMLDRSGLNCRIISGGTIAVGDHVQP
ncbi:MAG: MOSC domain-containing protein [Phycisphaerales bacterium]|nr:MOSC domain-containing protein [Phycisphaerales bacterium]